MVPDMMPNTMPNTMPVIEMQGAGGPEVLVPGTRAVPAPKPGQVLLRVAAAGVNGPDIMQRKGLYPPPPGASDLLGLEVSGEVVALGEGVTAWRVGDEVCALTDGGGYAGYVAVDAGHVLPVPPGVSLQDAAGLPETFITVWSNLFTEGGSDGGGPAAGTWRRRGDRRGGDPVGAGVRGAGVRDGQPGGAVPVLRGARGGAGDRL